jgi:hypothetical protein
MLRVDLLFYTFSDMSNVERLVLYLYGDCPIAYATSLTGKLRAAKYYFLD